MTEETGPMKAECNGLRRLWHRLWCSKTNDFTRDLHYMNWPDPHDVCKTCGRFVR